MKRNIHNFIKDGIVFLPCLLGLCFLDGKVESVYLVSCVFTFVQMEVFFAFLQMQHRVWRDMGAVLWLAGCHYVCPETAVITGNRSFLWLVLVIYLLIQTLRGRKQAAGIQRLGNKLLYLTNLPICFSRYFVTVFVLITYASLNDDRWYVNYENYQLWTGLYLLPVVMFSLMWGFFKWLTHRKMTKMKAVGISACVMHASIYDCMELYHLPRIWTLHMELAILTGHTAKQQWGKYNKLHNTYIGRYSVNLWEYAKELPDKTCVLYWNSKKDRSWSERRLKCLKAFIEELERYGCNIVIVDMYDGKKVYGNKNSIGAYLRKQYPYYYRKEMETMILSVKREKEAYRNLFIQIIEEVESWKPDEQQMLQQLLHQLTGNITSRVRCFYVLMKICEYVIHTEALNLLAFSDTVPRNIDKPSMGTFAQVLDKKEYITREIHDEVIKSVRFLDCVAVRNGKSNVKTAEVSYYIICEKLVNLRNRMIGHGTMVYSVSEELVENLARVTLFLLQRYSAKDIKLAEDMLLHIQGRVLPCICEQKGHLCLYNGVESDGTVLYLDYVTGNTIRSQSGQEMVNQAVEVSSFLEYVEETV